MAHPAGRSSPRSYLSLRAIWAESELYHYKATFAFAAAHWRIGTDNEDFLHDLDLFKMIINALRG